MVTLAQQLLCLLVDIAILEKSSSSVAPSVVPMWHRVEPMWHRVEPMWHRVECRCGSAEADESNCGCGHESNRTRIQGDMGTRGQQPMGGVFEWIVGRWVGLPRGGQRWGIGGHSCSRCSPSPRVQAGTHHSGNKPKRAELCGVCGAVLCRAVPPVRCGAVRCDARMDEAACMATSDMCVLHGMHRWVDLCSHGKAMIQT